MTEFTVKPYFEKNTDSIICYLKDERSYDKFINKELSLFLSLETDEIVGFEIRGVKKLIGG
ncbi:MAG: hypothetical protein DWQ19_10010 [Crenarchaeota archaeon]|nr:MAG: hypothetical protein DWQ19_10010 [Thermoproteota archaeon]